MNKEKMKKFIKENWVPLAIVTISAIGTGATVFFGIKSIKQSVKSVPVPEPKQLSELEKALSGLMSDPKFNHATVTDAWVDEYGFGEEPWLILNDLKVSDLGKLSEDLIANIPGVDENTLITCEMGLLK